MPWAGWCSLWLSRRYILRERQPRPLPGSRWRPSATSSRPSVPEGSGTRSRGLKALRTNPLSASAGTTDVTSTNWSGYADNASLGNTYTSVAGSWSEPKTTPGCSHQSGVALTGFWVGLDGYSDSTVEQDGTANVCDDGSGYDYDWYEMYPSGSVNIAIIDPGDKITASVTESDGSYQLTVTDKTHPADSFSAVHTCSPSTCRDRSAEWIGEAPCCVEDSPYPLSPFKTWKVTKTSVTSGSAGTISSFPNDNITMVGPPGDTVLAAPRALGGRGTKFNDRYYASS